MDANEKIVALLEEIAFNTSSHLIERDEYLRRIYATGSIRQGAIHAQAVNKKEAQKAVQALDSKGHHDGRR